MRQQPADEAPALVGDALDDVDVVAGFEQGRRSEAGHRGAGERPALRILRDHERRPPLLRREQAEQARGDEAGGGASHWIISSATGIEFVVALPVAMVALERSQTYW